MKITHASHLSDQELTTALRRLAQDEREATVALIVHLAEFDARRLYEPAGFSSLFKYCRAVLRLSEDAVYNRIRSARAARRFPVIVDMLLAHPESHHGPAAGSAAHPREPPGAALRRLRVGQGGRREAAGRALPRAGSQGIRAKSADGGASDRFPVGSHDGCLSSDRCGSGGRCCSSGELFGGARDRWADRRGSHFLLRPGAAP